MYQFFFPVSLFLSASLLFIIQPMVAKVLLPIYGGTPAVWTVCMLFFQLILLVGYGYAWVLSQLSGTRKWRVVHLLVCLLSVSFLPLAFTPISGLNVPELQILKNLLLQLGLPLLVVGASAPLLQFAFSQTTGKQAADPYFLYVASNSGSLLALLSYPWLIERFSGVSQQFYGWNIIYVVYLVVMLYLLFVIRYEANAQPAVNYIKIAWLRKMRWVYLSFIPCSLMLGVTFYITTDVAATPLFWVLPLALYLLSFVITFAKKPIISHAWVVRNTLIFLIFPILCFIIGSNQVHALKLIAANLCGFFMLALLCHGELVRIRPPAHQLTTFYLCLSLGGVFAGLFNGILAPRLFSHAYEYPLVMWLALLCIPIRSRTTSSVSVPTSLREGFIPMIVLVLLLFNYFLPDNPWSQWLRNQHVLEIIALCLIVFKTSSVYSLLLSMAILFIFVFIPWFHPTEILSQQRNFYGIKQVFSKSGAHVLMSQSTLHGFQVPSEEHMTDGARAYYGPVLPVVRRLQSLYQPLHAIVMGLGTGLMACQFEENDDLTMVELDEQVIRIASNPHLFTYLRDCPPHTTLVKDDGLLAVARAADASFELLVMDAFNSDAIPVHLLTIEAFIRYQQKITSNGVILVNISNRHLGVLPVLTAAGQQLDMIVLHSLQAANESLGQFGSEWVLLTSNERLANSLLGVAGWHFVIDNEKKLWTNDYSNLVPLLKW